MHFNSHPHEEDDDRFRRTVEGTAGISTHILTKRMTESPELHRCRVIFQLTSSRRGWLMYGIIRVRLKTFQLTSSRRGWRSSSYPFSRSYSSFQLTSSRRGWPYQSNRHGEGLVFQLTSSRRGWPRSWQKRDRRLSFQLTSSRRGWRPCFLQASHSCIFQLTSSRRGWLFLAWLLQALLYFNSHPHEEDD